MEQLRLKSIRPQRGGFTGTDLLALLAVVGLTSLIVVPGLAQGRARSNHVVCLNNLRLIGRALQVWQSEHHQADPWRTPYWEGGTQVISPFPPDAPILDPGWAQQRNRAWFEYSWLKSELGTPALLACPSDKRWVASDFSNSPLGGLASANYQDRAVSYFLNLDGSFALAGSALAGDRNLVNHGTSSSCSSGIGTAYVLNGNTSPFGWTNAIHNVAGNILFYDGRVEPRTSAELKAAFFPAVNEAEIVHLLFP